MITELDIFLKKTSNLHIKGNGCEGAKKYGTLITKNMTLLFNYMNKHVLYFSTDIVSNAIKIHSTKISYFCTTQACELFFYHSVIFSSLLYLCYGKVH